MRKDLPVWRSLLFVPLTQRRFVDGAARRGADAIILDLEDSVAASEKERARGLVPEAAEIVSRGGADVVVRLNRPMRMTVRDLEAAIGPWVQAVALPKAEGGEHVRLVAEIIDELEVERGMAIGTTKMLAMVETADAFFRIHEIAKASPRLVALNLGPRISHCRPACCPRRRGFSCQSKSASSRREPPALCRSGLSARSPNSTISTGFA